MKNIGPMRVLPALLFAAALFSAANAQQATDAVAPEAASADVAKTVVHASRQMVVAANPLATEAGRAVLNAGGSAADALVTVQTVLGLVEPQSSGIGGGAFLVWYDAKTGQITTYDGRETAPASATGDLFIGSDGKPLEFFKAVVGGRSVGAPGVVRLMETVHSRHGKLDWPQLFHPAIKLARDGFAVSPRLAALVEADVQYLGAEPTTRDFFFPGGVALKAGDLLVNEAYAGTLDLIAHGGADAFYRGAVAQGIVAAVSGHATNPGGLTADDLAAYKAVERPAICAPYRGYDVCGMGPPSSGAIAIGQILGMVEPFDISALGKDDPQAWRIIGDATRLAFADRERFVADADFVPIPKGLLNADYLASRSQLLRRPTALGPADVTAGEPPWDKAEMRRDRPALEMPSTTHFVIVDADGNVASMTSSIENGFGARLMAGGFLLNNQLTDFAFAPEKDGAAVANRVEPRKRPRSSMSPTIILKDGKPVYALGSPGGSNIIPYVMKTIIGVTDWKLDIQQAIALPNMTNRFGSYDLEAGTAAVEMAKDLEALGFKTAIKEQNSGLHGVAIRPGSLEGGADPRREGAAAGD
jgi:gamma-glutamyltranspeptidase/glutathione hydrolase